MPVDNTQPGLFEAPAAAPETPAAEQDAAVFAAAAVAVRNTEKVSITLYDAEVLLVSLAIGNDDPEGDVDRAALKMGAAALRALRDMRHWVRTFGREFTAAELAELADMVENGRPPAVEVEACR